MIEAITIGIALAGVAVASAVVLWRRRPATPADPEPAGELCLVSVTAPEDLKWSPQLAEAFVRTLLPVREELALRIHATARAITWEAVVARPRAAGLARALQALYPGA